MRSQHSRKQSNTSKIKDLEFAALRRPRLVAKTPETRLPKGITIFGKPDETDVAALTTVVKAYPDLWHERGKVVSIPESDDLQIPLKANWDEVAKLSKRVYPLGEEARRLLDDKSDELHRQGRME